MTILHNRIIRLLAVAGTLLLVISCSKNESPSQEGGFPPPPPVSVAEVVVRDVTPWNEYNGRIEAVETVQIKPRVGGVIEQVNYREGDIVSKGDLLFVLDQRPFRAALEQAQAELERAKARVELASAESKRAKNLFERKLLSADEFDERISLETQAKAGLRAAEAALQLARLDMNYTEVRSPIDGRTGRAFFTRGNLVASDPTPDVLTTVVSLDPVHVYFDSDESSYLRFVGMNRQVTQAANDRAHVLVGLGGEDGFPREGLVDFVDNQIDAATGTIRMRAVLDNKDHQLTPGLYARVRLLGSAPVQTFLIDDKSILTDQDRKYVYVIGPENKALRRDITIGRLFEGLRIVTAGLQQGDKVIVHGIQKVFFPGMPVSPQRIMMGDPPPMPGPPGSH